LKSKSCGAAEIHIKDGATSEIHTQIHFYGTLFFEYTQICLETNLDVPHQLIHTTSFMNRSLPTFNLSASSQKLQHHLPFSLPCYSLDLVQASQLDGSHLAVLHLSLFCGCKGACNLHENDKENHN
jgi:hypothetical protein